MPKGRRATDPNQAPSLWERRFTTPPNTETNATRSEVTVALAELPRSLRDAPSRKSAQECNFIKAYNAVVFSVQITRLGHTENKVISLGYGFITLSLNWHAYSRTHTSQWNTDYDINPSIPSG